MSTEMTAPKRTIDMVTGEILTTRDNVKRVFFEGVIHIGRCLEEAKTMVAQGEWTDYLQCTLGYKPSTAQNYMRIAREFGDEQIKLNGKSTAEIFGGLGYSQLLPLLGLPEEEREQLAQEHDLVGMSSREIEKLKKDYQAAQQAAELAQNRAEQMQEKAEKLEAAKEKLEEAKENESAARKAAEAKALELEGQVESILAQAQVPPLMAEVVPDEEVLARMREEMQAQYAKEAQQAQERAAELERKLAKAKNPAAVQVNFLFKELQSNWTRLFDALSGFEDAETAAKLKTAINQTVGTWRA